ncbi:hypothetical protein [Acuticoccus yangtzensis]|uniref:hypothetical protein n=1 Tax=Acuticoccus yangtzensis TaxID=1443441 RepID=UPI000D3E4665|nr:hypothetical protein [Acuticoccus yangtzensis]
MTTETRTAPYEEFVKAQPESNEKDYLAWRDEKVRRALKAKADGTQTYKSIDEIAARFGLNAR